MSTMRPFFHGYRDNSKDCALVHHQMLYCVPRDGVFGLCAVVVAAALAAVVATVLVPVLVIVVVVLVVVAGTVRLAATSLALRLLRALVDHSGNEAKRQEAQT